MLIRFYSTRSISLKLINTKERKTAYNDNNDYKQIITLFYGMEWKKRFYNLLNRRERRRVEKK